MKNTKIKSVFIIALVSTSVMFTGCVEDIKNQFKSAKGEVEKVMNPMPKCSDREMVLEVNRKLSDDALYGTHATLKEGTVLLTTTNEQTGEKGCKGVVTYKIDKHDNKISSFLSKVPVLKNVSKDRTIEYLIARHKDNETFIVHIK